MIRKFRSDKGLLINYFFYQGNEDCIIFLHNPGTNFTSMNQFLDFFIAKNFTVVAPDLRCHGYSDKGKIDYSNFLSDLKKLIEILPYNVYLVGNCISSTIVAGLWNHPKVKKLVFIMPVSYQNLTIRMKLLCFLKNILLNISKLFNGPRKKYLNWSKISHLSLMKYIVLVWRSMRLRDYLQSLKVLLQVKLNLDLIKKPSLIILSEKDYISKNKFIIDLVKENDFVRTKILYRRHVMDEVLKDRSIKVIFDFIVD